MKHVLLPALISLALLSQAFAVLRPPFPSPPAPPFEGELIIIGDDLVPEFAETPGASSESGYATRISLDSDGLCFESLPLVSDPFATARER
jgi:hypothetical protein